MTELAADPRRLRVRRGLAFIQVVRPALYALLVASAFFTFWAGGDIAGHSLPGWTRLAAPAVFAVFLVVFAIYRFALVRERQYPAMTGLFQVGLGALIWVLLLPSTRSSFAPHGSSDDVPALMTSADPRVRALAAEVAGDRGDTRYVFALIDRVNDSDFRVRERASVSLRKLLGEDPAGGELGREAQDKWRALVRERGVKP